jgi:hypothetical protein
MESLLSFDYEILPAPYHNLIVAWLIEVNCK